jgi:hypothetical protein
MRLLSSGSVTSVQSSDLFLPFDEDEGTSEADDERALVRDEEGMVSEMDSSSESGSTVVATEYERCLADRRSGS